MRDGGKTIQDMMLGKTTFKRTHTIITTERQFLAACLGTCTHSNFILPAVCCGAHFPNEKVEALFCSDAEVTLAHEPKADSDTRHKLEDILCFVVMFPLLAVSCSRSLS